MTARIYAIDRSLNPDDAEKTWKAVCAIVEAFHGEKQFRAANYRFDQERGFCMIHTDNKIGEQLEKAFVAMWESKYGKESFKLFDMTKGGK